MLARWWAVLIHQEPAETANPGREDAAELPRERRPYCLRPVVVGVTVGHKHRHRSEVPDALQIQVAG